MKKLLFFTFLLPLIAGAQILSVDSTSINFGVTMVGSTDSSLITITNNDSNPVQVNNIKFYSIYGDMPFSASQSLFTIAGNSSQTVMSYFDPVHNILHNSTMVIQHNQTSGHEAVPLSGQGRFPNVYYNVTENLEEQALKTALKTRTGQGFTQLSYNAARDAMFMTIDNKATNGQGATTNTLECVYTGFNKTGYTSRTNAQTTSPQFNTEHTFPQGFFNSNLPMRSDIHHLYPTTNNSNSQRGNKPFGIVTNGTAVTLGGGSFYNNNTFEPRNAQKGMTSRAMMYFVIRYQDYSNHFSSQQNILKTWHNTDPVSAIETKRNNDIAVVQGNRNPFVDYPQLEKRITNFVANSVAPVVNGIDVLQTAVDFGGFLNQAPDTFDYVMVNRGNQPISFSNFALTNPSILSFGSNSGANRSIAPGAALTIQVIAQTQTTTNFNESLTFNTNLSFPNASFTIPVRGNTFVTSVKEIDFSNQIQVFPNPLKDNLNIRMEGVNALDIRLLDILGKEVDMEFLKSTSTNKLISTENLAKGIYFLELKEGQNIVIKKLVK